MMKQFVVFCFLAVALAQEEKNPELTFNFLGTDGVSDPELLPLPFNFAGSVDITVTDRRTTDVWLCLHWIVPVVSPYGADVKLDTIWEKTCTHYETIPEGDTVFSVTGITLRSGEYYVTAAIDADIDSDGVIDDEYNFKATFSYLECQDGYFGDGCALPYTMISYDAPNVLPPLGKTPTYFVLPTNGTESNKFFMSSLDFTFGSVSPIAARQSVEYTMNARLNGAPGNEGFDSVGDCRGVTSKCSIHNPPFIFTPGYSWGLQLTASEDVDDVTLLVDFTPCKDGFIGTDCDAYENITTSDIGHVAKYSKKTTFVFYNTVNVAIGGLDGYTQQDIAPNVFVQIDSQPYADDDRFSDNVLVASEAEANVVMIDMSGSPDTKIVLTVTPDKSFGIWKIDENTQCPLQCDRNGQCSSQEFVCLCNEGYEDLDCMHEIKDFTIEYIILIAVGCLLILSIVIGVPIYCFLNRNQEYETVA